MEAKNIIFEEIETERLLMKGLTPSTFTNIFESLSKPEIMEILGHRTEDEYAHEEHKYQNGYASYNRSFMLFLMMDKATQKIIGRCGLHNWNTDHQRAEIGYVMIEEGFKQKGLMSEAVVSVIDFGFRKLNLHRIEALVGKDNLASLKIIKKNGFVKEGLMREHYKTQNGFEDSMVFSLLQSEYKNNLKKKD